MIVDIRPYWRKITNWYWDEPKNHRGGFSLWELLEDVYGIRPVSGSGFGSEKPLFVEFPDEKAYTLFVLKWS